MVTSALRLLPMGDRAILAEAADGAGARALRTALESDLPAGVVEVVPAARTVLVGFDPQRITAAAVRAWIEGRAADELGAASRPERAPVVLDVVYDGDDLADVAALLGVSTAALVATHVATDWSVAFTGFAPGFAYLESDGWPYDVPRLDAPRTRVPAGSVGLAGGYSGAYPRATPGGWRLIGRTATPLFDALASPPALLRPGDRVRHRAVRQTAAVASPAARGPADGARPGFVVDASGFLTTVQDLGRPAMAALGISRSGALDRAALRTANRLVGNAEDSAGLEVALGGFSATADRDLWVAAMGATAALSVGGRACDIGVPVHWAAGERLELGPAIHGVRTYIAVRGGIDVPLVAGSRSTDLLAGLGPAALAAGQRVAVGDDVAGPVPVLEFAPWGEPHDDLVDVDLAPGARTDWFDAESLAALFETEWTVGTEADRTGVRLRGPRLERVREGELPSEGMVPGAVQVPPSGTPTILLADGPVTGGYPVIAVVADSSLDALAQVRPGTRVRFHHARPPR